MKKRNKIIAVMFSQEKEGATEHKTFKHAGYRNKKGSSVDAWSQHPNLHR